MKIWFVASALGVLLTLGATPAPTVAQERAAVETNSTTDVDDDDDGGKLGLVGLLGLLGLMGLKRHDRDRDSVKRPDTR